MADISKVTIPSGTYDIKDATARDQISNLATVATTGSYNDLTDKPSIGGNFTAGDGIDITNNVISNTAGMYTEDVGGYGGNPALDNIIDSVYPIGSIYISVNNINPSTLWTNTTWVSWGSGKVPIGVDSSDTDFNTVEQTGGSKTASYTPSGTVSQPTFTGSSVTSGGPSNNTSGSTTLTVNQIPSHTHKYGQYYGSVGWSGNSSRNVLKINNTDGYTDTNNNGSMTTLSTGGGQGHTHTLSSHTHSITASGTVSQPSFTGTAASINTLQPYITCYMWKRTA